MHLIQRMKIWKELRRLEQRAKEQPSPSTFVDLGQVYINLDLNDKAERMAEDGLALFPKSIELRQLLDCARRGLRNRRAAELRAKLTRSPSPKLFRELARIQMDLGDSNALHATCQEWSLRFPDDAGCWLMLGQARLTSFYRDLAAREGQEAVQCLERAVVMDPAEVQSRRLLSEVLYRVGAVHEAQKHVQVLREIDPSDQEVEQLLSHIATLTDTGAELSVLLDEVESHGSLRNASLQAAAPVASADRSNSEVRAGLARVSELNGVQKATFIRGSKAIVKGQIKDGRDPFLRIVRVTAKAAHRFARRLDIGNASKTVVEGDFGRICICVFGEALAAAQCEDGCDVEQVLSELQELVAGALHAVEE
ncbi:MAG: putative regulator of Ras-like GTPase activity (Roadblock/LC7/MglB family) [Planctomycetota bacterium]|jgi:predicted regulator of Ras-like GTPase activity (Roadblock/LC7/MglB family)